MRINYEACRTGALLYDGRRAGAIRSLCRLGEALALAAAFVLVGACQPKEGRGANSARSAEERGASPVQQQGESTRSAASTEIDWQRVGQAMGKAGSMQPGDVYKVSLPRSDLRVSVKGVPVKPALALGSWVAFKATGNSAAMAMGDLVLTEDEVGPVMLKLREGGVEQTALHNHLLLESPRVMYMHIEAKGDPVKIAGAVHMALAASKTPMTAAGGGEGAGSLGIDTAQVGQALGYHGKVSSGVYQVSVPRAETIHDQGMEVPPSMGVATALNFQPTGGGKAAISGDFVLIASEVNPVIQALRSNGIEVTALHSHMLTEEPQLYFMHFWANDDAVKLARGLRAALDKINVKKTT
jgi:hypothetical protein